MPMLRTEQCLEAGFESVSGVSDPDIMAAIIKFYIFNTFVNTYNISASTVILVQFPKLYKHRSCCHGNSKRWSKFLRSIPNSKIIRCAQSAGVDISHITICGNSAGANIIVICRHSCKCRQEARGRQNDWVSERIWIYIT